MRKPRIYYVHLWGSWFCSTGVGLPGEPGEGATPKEAFVDWYCRLLKDSIYEDQKKAFKLAAEDVFNSL